ncbi:MAG: biotin/lipoyl-containing protein [Dehalococcoidales bacterium]|nr:biotin/lipoyl-containing protein [Dehalococcoidales bacterium]
MTEQITGIDIVEQMIRIAAGHALLPAKQTDVKINGWALESRVYAEDPLRGFLPSIGNLKQYVEPSGANVRVDSGVVEGSEISIHYDPMISKLITYGKDRTEALAHMRRALDSYVIRGVTHNINFLRSLCDHPRFIEGRLTTNFIPEEYPNGYKGASLSELDVRALVASAVVVKSALIAQQTSLSGVNKSFNAEKYANEETARLHVAFGAGIDAKTFKVGVEKTNTTTAGKQTLQMNIDGKPLTVESTYQRGQQVFDAVVDGKSYTLQVITSSDSSARLTLSFAGTSFTLDVLTPRQAELLKYMPLAEARDTSKLVVSPMPGAVFSIKVKVGEEVAAGQEVAVVEAMKMQNALRATNPGKVKAIKVKQGQTVTADQVLIEFE